MEIKQNKPSLKWVWIAATVIFCLFFTVVSLPGTAAQGSIQTQSRNYINTLETVFNIILRSYVDEVDPNVLFEGAMQGMFNALDDPYSTFMTASDMQGLSDTTQGSFGGVGLNITKSVGPRPDGRPAWVEVVSPIDGTPGWRAGINPGDFITEIDGIPTETITMDEVLGILRGTPGEDVRLMIRRGERLEFPLTITRAIIEVPTARHAMIGDIGYLRLLTFTPMTARDAREAINEFAANNFSSLILDLRNNSGGRLDAAIDVANLFLDSGAVVVQTRSRIPHENREFRARRAAHVPADIPIIVLINRGSASASEIVAGALKDNGRAYLVGENTFGKGSVQQVQALNNVGFKLTTARYFTPSDVNIDKVGIPPDREVRLPEFTEEDAVNLNRLINDNRIPPFAAQNPQATPVMVDAFAQTLAAEYGLDLSLLRRLIRNELNRTIIAPVYDLEHDVQLQEAVNILRYEDFQKLMENVKTLRALQEEAEERAAQQAS